MSATRDKDLDVKVLQLDSDQDFELLKVALLRERKLQGDRSQWSLPMDDEFYRETPGRLKWVAEHLRQLLDVQSIPYSAEDPFRLELDRMQRMVLAFAVRDTCEQLGLPVPYPVRELV